MPRRRAAPGRLPALALAVLGGAAALSVAGAGAFGVPRPPRPAAAAFTFVAGGDVALTGAGASGATFAGIRRFLHGDLVIANLEGTLASDGSPKCAPYGADGCYTFRAAPASALALRRAGFTAMNVANNHALDYGPSARAQTLAALRAAHLGYDGLPGEIEVVRAGAVQVALIGCAPYPWAQSLLDIPAAERLVRKARKLADVVLVYMHAGAEGVAADHVPYGPETFLGEQRGDPRAFAHAMIDAGASLVFASGPHTLRGLEWYHHHLIAYSLGDLAADGTLDTSGTLDLSALLSLKLTASGRFVSGRLVPLRLAGPGTPVYDPSGAAVSFVRTLSDEDFAGPKVRLAADGTIRPPAPRR
jgi:Bacterial capsule synthesis protein PGA_cap